MQQFIQFILGHNGNICNCLSSAIQFPHFIFPKDTSSNRLRTLATIYLFIYFISLHLCEWVCVQRVHIIHAYIHFRFTYCSILANSMFQW